MITDDRKNVLKYQDNEYRNCHASLIICFILIVFWTVHRTPDPINPNLEKKHVRLFVIRMHALCFLKCTKMILKRLLNAKDHTTQDKL